MLCMPETLSKSLQDVDGVWNERMRKSKDLLNLRRFEKWATSRGRGSPRINGESAEEVGDDVELHDVSGWTTASAAPAIRNIPGHA